jgi:hypothetical protein
VGHPGDHQRYLEELPGSSLKVPRRHSGLPNSNFRNQDFVKKNQEFIRRFFSSNQEENQEYFFRKPESH